MRTHSVFMVTLQCILLLGLCTDIAIAHPFHTSSAEMEWNPESNCFEVAWKIDPNDLEQELRRRTKQRLILEKLNDHEIVFDYVKDVFHVHVGEKALLLRPIGFEVEKQFCWIYFEIPCPHGLSTLELKNELLLNVHHQINTFVVKQASQKLAVTFHSDKRRRILNWDASSEHFISDAPEEDKSPTASFSSTSRAK